MQRFIENLKQQLTLDHSLRSKLSDMKDRMPLWGSTRIGFVE